MVEELKVVTICKLLEQWLVMNRHYVQLWFPEVDLRHGFRSWSQEIPVSDEGKGREEAGRGRKPVRGKLSSQFPLWESEHLISLGNSEVSKEHPTSESPQKDKEAENCYKLTFWSVSVEACSRGSEFSGTFTSLAARKPSGRWKLGW